MLEEMYFDKGEFEGKKLSSSKLLTPAVRYWIGDFRSALIRGDYSGAEDYELFLDPHETFAIRGAQISAEWEDGKLEASYDSEGELFSLEFYKGNLNAPRTQTQIELGISVRDSGIFGGKQLGSGITYDSQTNLAHLRRYPGYLNKGGIIVKATEDFTTGAAVTEEVRFYSEDKFRRRVQVNDRVYDGKLDSTFIKRFVLSERGYTTDQIPDVHTTNMLYGEANFQGPEGGIFISPKIPLKRYNK